MAETEHKLKITTEYEDKVTSGLKTSQAAILDFSKAAEKAGRDVSKAFDSQTKAAQGASKGLTSAFSSLKASTIAAAAAVTGLVVGIGKIINEITEAEDTTKRFSFALKSSGINSQEAVTRFQAFAKSIQATTKFSDEAILSLGTLFTSAGIGYKDLQTASKAAIELSARFGKTLDEAGNLVVRSFAGQTRELKFLIPGIENLTEAQLRAGEGAKLIARVLGGSAEQDRTTLAGAWQSIKNAVSEVAESMVTIFGPAINTTISLINKAIPYLNSFAEAIGAKNEGGGTRLQQAQRNLQGLVNERQRLTGLADEGTGNALANEFADTGLSNAQARALIEDKILKLDKEIRDANRAVNDLQKDTNKQLNVEIAQQEKKRNALLEQTKIQDKQKELIPKKAQLVEQLEKELNTKIQYAEIEKERRLQLVDELNKAQLLKEKEKADLIMKINLSAQRQGQMESFNQVAGFINMGATNPLGLAGAGIGAAFGGPAGAQIGAQIPGLLQQINQALPNIIQDTLKGAGGLIKDSIKTGARVTAAVFTGGLSEIFGGLFSDGPAYYDKLSDAIAEKMDKTEFAMALRDLSGQISEVGNPYRTDAQMLSRARGNLRSASRALNPKALFQQIGFQSSDFGFKWENTPTGIGNGTIPRMVQTGFSGNLFDAQKSGVDLQNGKVRILDAEKFQDALKGIGEQLKDEAKAIKEYTDLRIKELDRLKSAREGAKNIFSSAIEAVSGALRSPEQTVAMLTEKFQTAKGEKKAIIGTQLAGGLQAQFQQAQALASQGAITGEELQSIQSSILAQLGSVQQESISQFDKMIKEQEKIRDAALKQIDYLASIDKAIKANDVQKLIDFFKNAPKFAEGTSYVSNTGFAMVHQGEKIIPKGGNSGSIVVNINGVGASGSMKDEIVRVVRDALKANSNNLRGIVSRSSK